MQRAGEGPTGDQGQGRRRAHSKHVGHVRDLGRVETQWLVERRRVLPSRKEDIRSGRHAGRELGGRGGGGGACIVQARARLGIEGRARAERTANMRCMSMTPDVSKLSDWLNAAAYCRVERRACDAGGMRAGRC